MAVTVDWSSYPYDIEIPQSDLTLVSGTRYQITVDHLWGLLRDFSDGPEGSARPTLFRRTAATASTPAITEINDPFYSAHFEDGLYSVDIIDGNTNFRDVEVKNQVSVGTNNTTGFINPVFLELGLFNGAVCVDTLNGFSGTDKTGSGGIIGTRSFPSNNITDAKTIANSRGLHRINLVSNLTITSEDLSDGYEFTGDSPFINLTINASANVLNCSTKLLTVSGELDGLNTIRDCSILNVTGASGYFEKVAFVSGMTLTGDTAVFESYSQVPGDAYPVFNTAGSNALTVRDFHGSLGVSNMTGGTHSIGVYGGRLVVEDTCTGGQINVRGLPFEIVDHSNGAVTILDQTDSKKVTEIWTEVGKPKKRPGFPLT